jgi:hypothetical protein
MKYAVYYGDRSYVVRQTAAEVIFHTANLAGKDPFTIVGIREEAPDEITGDYLDFIFDWFEPYAVPIHEYSTPDEYADFIAFGDKHPAFKFAVHAYDLYCYGKVPGSYRDFVAETENEEYARALGFEAARNVLENFSDSAQGLWDEARARTDTVEEANSLYMAMIARDSRVSVCRIAPNAPNVIDGSWYDFCEKWRVR